MKKLLPLLAILILLVGLFLFFRGNRPSGSPATIWEQSTEMKVEAAQIFNEFIQDEAGANEKYLNKIVEVSGEVKSVQSAQGRSFVVLRTSMPDLGVRCRFDYEPGESVQQYEIGQKVRFKCLCSGFVNDVEMVQCKAK